MSFENYWMLVTCDRFIGSSSPWVSADKGCSGYLIVKSHTLNSVHQGFLINVGHILYIKYLFGHRELLKTVEDRTLFCPSFPAEGIPFGEDKVTYSNRRCRCHSVTEYFPRWDPGSVPRYERQKHMWWCIMAYHSYHWWMAGGSRISMISTIAT